MQPFHASAPSMPICTSCPHCGTVHPSRVRARGEYLFAEVNEAAGSVMERCPRCGRPARSEARDRVWRDAAPATRPA